MGTLSGQSLGLAYVKPDGSYAIDGLEDGRYTLLLIVWTDNNEVYEVKRFATAAVDVADGETTTADFELSD
jgi:hypothetical protein